MNWKVVYKFKVYKNPYENATIQAIRVTGLKSPCAYLELYLKETTEKQTFTGLAAGKGRLQGRVGCREG